VVRTATGLFLEDPTWLFHSAIGRKIILEPVIQPLRKSTTPAVAQ
jgi:hypothetical protein